MHMFKIKKLIIQWDFLLLLLLYRNGVNCTLTSGGSNVCTKQVRETTKYYSLCWDLWSWFSCTKYRTVYVTVYECCEDYTTQSSSSSGCTVRKTVSAVKHIVTAKCVSGWNSCPNGGTCTEANHCDCRRGYFSPECARCTQIANCDSHECTSSTDQRCVDCNYYYTEEICAYRPIYSGSYPDRVCEQLCSWRPDSKQCYPGVCGDRTPNDCDCAPDFGGTDCKSITMTPDIIVCLASVIDSNGEKGAVKCEDVSMATKYTNIRAQNLEVNWATQYEGPDARSYPFPYYVADYDVGLISAAVDWTISRGNQIASGSLGCSSGISEDNPYKTLLVCDHVGSLSTSLISGDILQFSPKSTNGGRLQIRNYDNSGTNPTIENQYYSGRTLTHTASFTFDFDPPYHCLGSCSSNMLDRGNPFTRQATFDIAWGGWRDDTAGVATYQYEVYKFKANGDGNNALLDYKTEPAIVSVKVSSFPPPTQSVTLDEPGMYCVILIVYDNTSDDILHANHKLARRFLFYDNSSEVETSDHSNHQLFVNSAPPNTSYEWITTLDEQVTLQWKGHFFNELHRTNLLLNAIAPHSTEIGADYEERTGQPNGLRSMEAIPNVNGIIRYDFMYATDHAGGRSITSPTLSWKTLVNFQIEEETITIPRVDGDSIRFWVKAFDVMNNTLVEEVLVHVDSSHPHIENVGLVRDGDTLLMVHSNVDLFDLVLEFDTYDYHSGMKQITWALHDMKDLTVYGQGAIPVVTTNKDNPNCTASVCYCIEHEEECFMRTYQIIPEQDKLKIPYGDHDFDYVFVITVVNNAMLQTVHRFQITIDVSPPLPGHVFDSESTVKDSDYQSNLLIHAFWNGFFDRESGIKHYRYAIHTACLTKTDFEYGISPPVKISTTFDTFASDRVTTSGTYYTTVVAVNHALELSHPVCSDGITVDTTPPVVGSIHVNNAFIKPGLVSDGNNMMYMDIDGYVYKLAVQTEDCITTSVNELSVFEIRSFPHPIKPQQDNCSSYSSAGTTHYLATENMFEMTWTGSDTESTVHDYMIALSSTETAIGDIMPYTSTHGHKHFITYHPNLVNFEEFYVGVKATNKAALETLKIAGPFQVRVNGPTFDGVNSVQLQKHESNILIATFNNTAYNIEDITNSYLSSVEYALGEGSCSGNLISWMIINNTENSFGCSNTWPQSCVFIDTEVHGFHLHHNMDYCLSVRLYAYNKMVTSCSAWYTHRVPTPSAGLLWEINTADNDLVKRDIDFQVSTESLQLRFVKAKGKMGSNLQYMAGVGTTPGKDNIQAFANVDIDDTFAIEGLTLELNTEYFSVLKVIDLDTDEHSLVLSDGVRVLPENTDIPGFVVNDGVTCQTDKSLGDTQLNHHTAPTDIPECDTEKDFQAYTTVLSSYWTYDETDLYIQYFQASVEIQDKSNGEDSWSSIITDYFVGNTTEVILNGLHLEGGRTYRVVIQGCHPAGCYVSKGTDGVMILPIEPTAEEIVDVEYADTETSLTVTWNPFVDAYHGVDFHVISQYAISIFVRPENLLGMNQITKWTHLHKEDYNIHPETGVINATYILDYHLEASSCLFVGVRGYNRAMLFSTSYKEFLGCTVTDRYPLQIFDAVGEILNDRTVGDITLSGNDAWLQPDAEYTQSKTSISAVWPTLRHSYMRWSVVHGDNVNRVAFQKSSLAHLDYLDFECASPEVLACGSTYDRFINVHNLILEEGSRYHVCIFANTTTLEHEKWSEGLPEVSVCSDGVTVDTEPPIAGSVWTGNRQEYNTVQSDNSVLVVHWASFVDVEVNQRTSHQSGIKTYLLALGSSMGSKDVLDFQDVGLTNLKILSGLSLRNGGTYYITIKAQDYVGLETSVTSQGVKIDVTEPLINTDKLIVSKHYLTANNIFQISYSAGVFMDPESGISKYMWCIGSKPNLCDVLASGEIIEPVLTISADTAVFSNGQEYHVLLEAYNGAGLAASTLAAAFVADLSAPSEGFVFEVGTDISRDIDYQVTNKELHLIWGDFNDLESHIMEYRLTIGSCQGCADILSDVYVGLIEEYKLTHVELKPGTKYFTQVRACNSAGLCTTVSSDGITVDGTPPHMGRVYDGITNGDIDFQPKNKYISAHLENVHDLQSGLSIITWWAGTTAGDRDVFTEETTHSHTVLRKMLETGLSDGTTVFVTVKACNKAGLCMQKSSDGCTIDTTAPTLTGDIKLVPNFGTLSSNYQIYRNTMALQWFPGEDISPIMVTYISLQPQGDAHLILPTVKLVGNPVSHVLAGLDLRDGDCYVVKVTVCNAASLCTQATSTEFVVDSSPPTSGAFAVDTEHAIELSRYRDSWMTYNNAHVDGPQVKLAWLGFQDPHSDVLRYIIHIGSELYSRDIAEYATLHTTSDAHRDEGYVVTETVPISRMLMLREQIYISIYAINKAGLHSRVHHGLFTAIPSGGDTGTLELERRCDTLSCIGHCMCAPHGFHGCDTAGVTCIDRTGESGYAAVTIYDTLPSIDLGLLTDIDYIPSRHILHADWKVGSGIVPKWFDWSVGMKDQSPGSGLLDVNKQRIWYEAGTTSNAVFSMAESELADKMSIHVTYVFYVKAWYNESSYAVFQSDGVQVDGTAPELSDSFSVKEMSDPNSSADVDFTSSPSTITVKWTNVFRDGQSGLDSFEVAIYSNKQLSAIVTKVVGGTVDELTLVDLTLTQGEHYVSKVVACNHAGLCIQAASDGFLLDTTPPYPGLVLDGSEFQDIQYSYHNNEVWASWQGYYDDESPIDYYVWCVMVENNKLCDNVGLYQQKKMLLPDDPTNGMTVSSTVYAINGANLSSTVISSDGFILDLSPPTDSHHFHFESSIILNGNFEYNTDNWEISVDHSVRTDNKLCIVNGYFSQELSTIDNQKYRLQFDVVNGFDSAQAISLGYVKFGQSEHHIVSAVDNKDDLHLRRKVYFVSVHGSTSVLQFGTMGDMMICVGNIRLEPIQLGERDINSSSDREAPFSSSVHVHVIASSVGTTVVLNWDFDDLESPLVDYMFAVGTVQGGIQLQDFTSTGRYTTATLPALKVQHGTILHVTVVAINAVGLSAVVYADPVTVDLTTPVIELFQVNGGNMVLSTLNLNIEWNVSDPESGVQSCLFSMEHHNDATFTFPTLSWGASGSETVTLSNLNNGDSFSCKITCNSFGDMYTVQAIDPLKYVTVSPNTESASVYVIPYSETYHSNRDNYLPSANMVWFKWDGIVDPVGIDFCEVTVSDENNDTLKTIPLGDNQHSTVVLQNGTDIFEESTAYNLTLTCVNKGGFESDPITTQFHIDSALPTYTGRPLGVFWTSDTVVNLNWSGLFSSESLLFYEIQFGTTQGGNDVLSWLEMKSTNVKVTNLNSVLTHYLSISAISQSGFYTTRTFTVQY